MGNKVYVKPHKRKRRRVKGHYRIAPKKRGKPKRVIKTTKSTHTHWVKDPSGRFQGRYGTTKGQDRTKINRSPDGRIIGFH